MSRVIHGRRAVDLDQPGIEVRVQHDIETIQLKTTSFVLKGILDRLKSVDDDGPDLLFDGLFIDVSVVLVQEVFLQLFDEHHVALDIMCIHRFISMLSD